MFACGPDIVAQIEEALDEPGLPIVALIGHDGFRSAPGPAANRLPASSNNARRVYMKFQPSSKKHDLVVTAVRFIDWLRRDHMLNSRRIPCFADSRRGLHRSPAGDQHRRRRTNLTMVLLPMSSPSSMRRSKRPPRTTVLRSATCAPRRRSRLPLESERMHSAWIEVMRLYGQSRQPLFRANPRYDATLNECALLRDHGHRHALVGPVRSGARGARDQPAAAAPMLRQASGIEVLADCVIEFNAAMARFFAFDAAPPDLAKPEVAADVASKATQLGLPQAL